jgi:hypothetical protein
VVGRDVEKVGQKERRKIRKIEKLWRKVECSGDRWKVDHRNTPGSVNSVTVWLQSSLFRFNHKISRTL